MSQEKYQSIEKVNKELKETLLNKIFELQGSSFDPKEQVSTLINFVQSLFEIESIAIYANFAGQEMNLINAQSSTKQYALLGSILESLSDQVNLRDSRFYNSLISISELNINNISEADLNTYIYPIVSPLAKQIYGIILIKNPKELSSGETKKLLLFILNYIIKIIEEADLASQVKSKEDKLLLLSRLSNSLKGLLKPEKAIEIVLKEIHRFLKLDSIYFIKWINPEKRLEFAQELVNNKQNSLLRFTHKATNKNPIIKLLYKNQYVTYKNKNVRRVANIFLNKKQPSTFCIIPVIIRNELLGGIVCVNTSSSNVINTEDLRITQDIAGQLAVILNQSSLYEESLSTAQREFLLNSITTMIRDTLEVSGVLEKTAREIGQVFGVNACGAFMLKEDESGFVAKSIWATQEEYKTKLAQLPLDYNLWENKKTSLIPDPITQSIAISNLDIKSQNVVKELIFELGCKSYLACSLNKGDRTIGVLVLAQFENYRNWTSSEVQLLEAITDQVEMALSQAELHEHVQQTERQMNLLHQVSTAIRDSLNLSTVMARAAEDLGEIFSSSRCFIRRLKTTNPLVVLATEKEYLNKEHNVDKAADLILDFEQEWLESLNNLPEVERANSLLQIIDIPTRYKNSQGLLKSIIETIKLKSFLAVPLVARGQVIGSLCVHQCDRNRKFTENEIEFARRVASEASVAVLNADLFSKVEYQAQRDGLTGLYNHGYFQTAIYHETERAKRTGSNMSVISVDLDHLKPINDKFGHKAGDEAITLVAGKLQQCLRQMDIVARAGGDEFSILLPETNLDIAEQIAKRILETLNRTIHPQWGPLSASIGVSGTPHEERNKDIIMKAADDSMYVSKKEGRNRVTTSKKLDELGPIEQKPISRGEGMS